MKKILIIFIGLYSINAFAYYTENITNQCGVIANNFVAIITPNEHTCSAGYYLPANTDGCQICTYGYTCSGGTYTFNEIEDQGIEIGNYTCSAGYYLPANAVACVACPAGFTCDGGTFTFNENEFQGATPDASYINESMSNMCATNAFHRLGAKFTPNTHTCNAGYYLPAGVDACTICPANSVCAGGTYTFNETTDQGIVACATPTPYAPTGSSVCYPHIFHVGNDIMYMKSVKQTTPSLNIQIGNDIFYINMTTTRTKMNKDSIHYFHVDWDDNHYYVCDDTMCPDGQ